MNAWEELSKRAKRSGRRGGVVEVSNAPVAPRRQQEPFIPGLNRDGSDPAPVASLTDGALVEEGTALVARLDADNARLGGWKPAGTPSVEAIRDAMGHERYAIAEAYWIAMLNRLCAIWQEIERRGLSAQPFPPASDDMYATVAARSFGAVALVDADDF